METTIILGYIRIRASDVKVGSAMKQLLHSSTAEGWAQGCYPH